MAKTTRLPAEARTGLSEARKAVTRIKTPVERSHAAGALMAALQAGIEDTAAIRRGAIRELYESGWTLTDLANEFGITRPRASQIINS
jgi:hypothetical protein